MTDNFDLILPFLRPIAHYIQDPDVSEVMVNADESVWVERDGLVAACPEKMPQYRLMAAVRNIARVLSDEIDERTPLLNSRLPDGSRVAAAIPPASVGGAILTIRKFRPSRYDLHDLIARDMLTWEMGNWLIARVQARDTILISGGTGSGKTSLLNALAAFLPPNDRVVLIEDTSEISINSPNLVRLEARRAQPPDVPEVSIRDLLRHTLRLRPDRIILGEVRGGEAFDLLQALNTGHTGTLSTIHANSAELAVSRLRTCVAMAGIDIPDRAIARNVAEVVQVVVHIERGRDGSRYIKGMKLIDRYVAVDDEYEFSEWEMEEVADVLGR